MGARGSVLSGADENWTNFDDDLAGEYMWLIGVIAIFATFAAFGIGSNDGANAFGTCVGARSLSVRQATFGAACLEFFGALVMGRKLSLVLISSVVDMGCYYNHPVLLMWAMAAATIAHSITVVLASVIGVPISTTHAHVASILGAVLASRGAACVSSKGVAVAVLSAVAGPILALLSAAAVYTVYRRLVLRHPAPSHSAMRLLPILSAVLPAAFAPVVAVRFMVSWGLGAGDPVAVLSTMVMAGAAGAALGLRLKRQHERRIAATEWRAKRPAVTIAWTTIEDAESPRGPVAYVRDALNTDLATIVQNEDSLKRLHDKAEAFKPSDERASSFVHVIAACLKAVLHGAVSLASAVGPLSVAWTTLQMHRQRTPQPSGLDEELFAVHLLGGIAIALGVVVYGYRLLFTLGLRVAHVSPARGLSASVGAAVATFSAGGLLLPVSTSHCEVAAILGVAWVDGGRASVNGPVVVKAAAGSIAAVVVGGVMASIVFSVGEASARFVYSG